MSRNQKIAKLVETWAKAIGIKQATSRLIARELSISVADRLCNGRYDHTPGTLVSRILVEEMAKDGFTVSDDKAS